MSKILILAIAFLITALASCEKDETKAILKDDPNPPILMAPTNGTSLVLSAEKANDVIVFIWEKADFGFNASVKYTIQVDTLNSVFNRTKGTVNFAALTVVSDSAVVNYKDFNAKLLKPLNLPKNTERTVEVRVRGILENLDTVYSSPISLKVTTY